LNDNKKILAVLAHPDDETFGMGGTLAYYAQQGVEVYLVCATRGEVGEVEPEMMKGFSSKGELREHELRCAANTLGIREVYFLDYRDSGMAGSPDNTHPKALAAQPVQQVAEKVVRYIRQIQPDVVLTFDPLGGYHHPDHIAIHQAAVAAFAAAGDAAMFKDGQAPYQPERLYFHVLPRLFMRLAVRIMRLIGKDPTRFGRNQDINLEQLAGDRDYPRHVSINFAKVAEKQQQATLCHASQLDFGRQSPRLLKWARMFSSKKDYFMQAYPPVAQNYHAHGLFDGV